MVQHSNESTHIIWSMLFVAGALWLSYVIAGGRTDLLLGGEVGQVIAETVPTSSQSKNDGGINDQDNEQLLITPVQVQQISNERLPDTEEVVSLSAIASPAESSPVLQDSSQRFEAPEVVQRDGKQFFSVQQLFADLTSDGSQDISQGVLELRDTYQWTNNGRFVLPEAIGVQDQVQYILKDQRNTHYVYLGDYTPLVFEGMRQQDTVVAIEEKVSINRSGFFGDGLWLFSIPEYDARQKIIALIRLEAEGDTWLFQIDRDRFANGGKQHLYDSFSDRYVLEGSFTF